MAEKFKIGQKVTSAIDKCFIAQVHTIIRRKTGTLYECTYFDGSNPKSGAFYNFELEPLQESKGVGFKNEG